MKHRRLSIRRFILGLSNKKKERLNNLFLGGSVATPLNESIEGGRYAPPKEYYSISIMSCKKIP